MHIRCGFAYLGQTEEFCLKVRNVCVNTSLANAMVVIILLYMCITSTVYIQLYIYT